MAAPIANVAINRGDSVSLTLTVTWPAGSPDTNLNDYAIKFTAKNSPMDADAKAIFQLTTGGGGINVSNNTQADIQIPASATVALACTPPNYTALFYYDVQIIGPDVKPHTVVQGLLTVSGDITKAIV